MLFIFHVCGIESELFFVVVLFVCLVVSLGNAAILALLRLFVCLGPVGGLMRLLLLLLLTLLRISEGRKRAAQRVCLCVCVT